MPKAQMPPEPWRQRSKRGPRRAPTPKIERYAKSPTPIPSTLNICAVDPGYTTGMAFRIKGKLATCVGYSDDEVLDLINVKFDIVVVERFATAGRLSAPGLHTIELVGQIKGLCRAMKIPCELATPQMRYNFMEEAINSIGVGKLIEPSNVQQHERDALAHLLSWEYRNRK